MYTRRKKRERGGKRGGRRVMSVKLGGFLVGGKSYARGLNSFKTQKSEPHSACARDLAPHSTLSLERVSSVRTL